MTTSTPNHPAADTLGVVRDRCLSLGLPTVALSADGSLALPGEGGVAERWASCAFLRRLLTESVRRWAAEDDPRPAPLFEGAWALPAYGTHRRRRQTYLAAVMLTPQALHSEQFVAACQSAGLDEEATRAVMAGCAVHRPQDAARLTRLVRWLWEDQQTIREKTDLVAGFSRQLAESYEETNLLYRLGRAMNELVQPAKFVRQLCEELHSTLSFRWIAVGFVDDPGRARAMSGRCLLAPGDAPAAAAVRATALRLVREMDHAGPRVLRLPAILGEDDAEALVHPVVRDGAPVAAIVAGEKHGDDLGVTSVDIKLLAAAASSLGVLLDNAALYDDQQSMFLGTLKALTASIDAKDRYTRGHSERVAHLTRALAQAFGLQGDTLERVHIAGLVHDVGKIGVPEQVLRKPGRLEDHEFALIKKHPEIGHNILKDIPQLADVLPGVLHHHERWDGRGYPAGLSGADIPFVARLIALADSFDAMSSSRTYRAALPRERAMEEIEKNAGVQFDPRLARLFVRLDFSAYDLMAQRHAAQETQAQAGPGPLRGEAAA